MDYRSSLNNARCENRGRRRGRASNRGSQSFPRSNFDRRQSETNYYESASKDSFHSGSNPRFKRNDKYVETQMLPKPSRGNSICNQGSQMTPVDEKYWRRKKPLSFQETKILLHEMLKDDYQDNIPLKLLDSQVGFDILLNNDRNQDVDLIETILNVILKANENKMTERNFRDLLTKILRTEFSKKRLDKLINIELTANFDVSILQLLIKFLKLNFEIIPGIAYEVFYNRVFNLNSIINSLQLNTTNVSPDILIEFNELKELAKASDIPSTVKKFQPRRDVFNDIEPPDNYKTISIFPTSKDLIGIDSKMVFLRENKSHGAYQSVEHYLDVQFRLMREDFIKPLREGLNTYKCKDKKKHLDIRIYNHVNLLNSLPTERLGVIYNMTFDKSRLKKVKWAQSKRFLYGSLLCLSCDNFQTLLFGILANRDIRDLENGIISVKFYEWKPSKDEEYTLIETTNMFESYRHVLLKLQDTNEETLCMKKYLVYSERQIALPNYLARNTKLEYRFKDKKIWPGDVNLEWPRAVELDMDESQFQAFKSALTNELTIIQGPPGTGKTYLGLNICECLIKNVQNNIPRFGPILVVCYTNHALDQFLEGVSNFTDRIVRVGSRCKSEKLQQFSIINWKKKCPSSEFSRQKWAIFGKLKELKDQLIYKQAALKNSQEKLITLDKLRIFVDEEQLNYLKIIGLRNWLYGDSFMNENSISDESLDTIVEWLMYEEIIYNVHQIVIDAQTELLGDNDAFYDNDMDTEVNYINNQRKLDIDEEDISNLNVEFNRALDLFGEPDESLTMVEPDSDGFTLVKNKTTKRLFESRLRRKDKMTHEEASQIISLDQLSIETRWTLYRFWRSKYTDFLHESSEHIESEYESLSNQINEIHFEEDRFVMKDQTIIGMTTTGAARYNKVLSLIQCKIIIVEEAAEVLESHIVGALNPGCEHLILIGDHKQLKPSPAVFELAKKYEMDVSLFERLINNQLHYNTLSLQHRMRPEIADIMQFIYKDLRNHESVLKYPNVPSVTKNLLFIDHFEKEECTEDIMSYSNPYEADFVIKFCRHLMKNGVERTQMTILTLYSGQMFLLRRLMDRKIFEGVRVCVVDNYQGEENDIILLSLVRSNEFEKIGFLNIENRICVSLSRAKHGLYVFGNFQILTNQNKKWEEICFYLKRKEMLNTSMTLSCQNHPNKRLMISKPSDFDNYPEGGCEELCNHRLSCGHACRKSCHFLDRDHKSNKCLERCTRLCTNGHRCSLKCWQECKECNQKIEKVIPSCNHKQLMSCSQAPEATDCLNKCDRMLLCGHICTQLCKEKCGKCFTKVYKIPSRCNHNGMYYCHDTDIKCTKKCNSILGCEHPCQGTCGSCYMGRLHETCQSNCKALLICGHACKVKCSLNCPPCQNRCEEGCSHNACPNNCGEQCVSCFEKCKWKCHHKKCGKLCYELCDRDVCDEFCSKMLDCKKCKIRFKCYGICGEPCRKVCLNCDPEVSEIFFGTEEEVNARFITLWTCEHSFEVNSMDTYMNSVPENGEIVTKKCPRCNTIINKRSCFRYINIVKLISFDIKNVQNKIIDQFETCTYIEFSKKLDTRGSKISKIFKMHKIENYFDIEEKLNQFQILPYNTSLDLIYNVYQLCYSKSKNIDLPYIFESVSDLIAWLNPKNRKFNQFEMDQFNAEYNRIDMFLKINERKRQMNLPSKEILNFLDELKSMTFSGENAEKFSRRWTDYQRNKLFLPNTEITEYERNEIVKAIGLDKGRWFKCPNGHFYVIGECGGANQVSKCNDCGATIGGTNHRLQEGNQFAPEIDGAVAPAFPGMDRG